MNKLLLTILFVLLFSFRITAVNSSRFFYTADNFIENIYCDCGLDGLISFHSFKNAMEGYRRFGASKTILAVCDFSKPSNKKRFLVIDLQNKKVLTNTWVAHGKNSGDLMATRFSNKPESLQSSLGFFRVGSTITDKKLGLSMLLDGLEPGLNDNARMRGIIIHGAWYVSEAFVKQYGYTGKSFGCPALPQTVIDEVTPILKDGALLYICKE